MKTEDNRTTETPDDILNELRALVGEAEKILEGTADENRELSCASLRERYEAARERLADHYERARQKAIAGAKFTDQAIRENPYQSLAIAVGVGVLAGVLIGRRSK